MQDTRNFFLAIGLSMAVVMLYQYFVAGPEYEKQQARLEAEKAAAEQMEATNADNEAAAPVQSGDLSDRSNLPSASDAPAAPGTVAASANAGTAPAEPVTREQALQQYERVQIKSGAVEGSIRLAGARLDELRLLRYREKAGDPGPENPIVTLLSPKLAEDGYYAEFGWLAGSGTTAKLPTNTTVWSVKDGSADTLTPETPVELVWDNGEGLIFSIKYEIDQDYLITATQSVTNASQSPVTLSQYGVLFRRGIPESQGFWVLHEGLIGVFKDEVVRKSYGAVEGENVKEKSADGWLGITDKYWMTALIPDGSFTGRFLALPRTGEYSYQVDYVNQPEAIAPGTTSRPVGNQLFAGAKKVSVIDRYHDTFEIPHFNLSIDWGWFWFLTIPFFQALDWLAKLTGNFGVAILLFTVLVKAVFFPIANKSYEAMTKMKKVHPKMMELRERYKDDKMKQQQELMELYKKEKVNPLAGCLPMLIQIPVFFALYKVLFVTIEMRHAPFFGWIQDLSAPDPTTIFNLFGLIPWDPSAVPMIGELLMIGIWPIFMGITMWFQMKMNPQPTDEIQRQVFTLMPYIFTVLLASFSAGLVIYWAWNNLLSILQQYVIMRRMGVEPEWKNNLKLPDWLGGKKTAEAAAGEGAVTTTAREESEQDKK